MADLNQIALRLRTALRLLVRRGNRDQAPGAPTRSEQGVLAWLDEKDSLTASGLAALEKVRPQTMAQTLDGLTRRRWIRRTPCPRDRRQVLLSLSPSGRKAMQRARDVRQAWLVTTLRQLDARDRQTLNAALDVLDRIAHS
ncbi:MAG: MarR family transcriptional regulator [Verrucomicrobiota bacterium]